MANKLLLADGQYEVITVDTTLVGIAGKQYWYRNGSAGDITVTYGGALKALNPNEVVGLVYDGSVWTEISGKDGLSDVLPIGGIFTSSAGVIPTGFVEANGQALSRTLYSLLNEKYADMGYPYGNGDGSTTFNVPDLPAESPFITIVNARRVPDQEYVDEIQIDSRLTALENTVGKDLPIGFEYTQRAGRPTPSGLGLIGIWENVSSEYAGLFDRIEGGNALAFGGGIQSDKFQGHEISGNAGGSNSGTGNGATPSYAGANPGGTGDWISITGTNIVTDGVNGTPRTGIETNPINSTVRIWRRTA